MQQKGLVLRSGGQETVVRPRCVASADEAGPQDYVVVTLKAHSLPGAAKQMQPLLGPETAIVSAVNGIPWWYFFQFDGPHRDHRLKSVDPDGSVWELLHPSRAIGCIVYPAAEVPEPGVIEHTYGDRLHARRTRRAAHAAHRGAVEALIAAGFKAPVRPKIRDEIWVKLWGNLAFNPISALTTRRSTCITADPASAPSRGR
jgi:2-dehydropantoate 2-reductase